MASQQEKQSWGRYLKRPSSEEDGDLDSSGSTLSVDEESPVETLSEVLPVSLKRSKNVLISKRESNDNAREWDVQKVKEWAESMFHEEVAENFEREEIDGITLQSERILTDESMNSLGLTTIGKKSKFVVAVQTLFGKSLKDPHQPSVKRSRLQPLTSFEEVDRILTNREKDELSSMDRSIYNTKKKRIIAFTKSVWPEDEPAPWFRGNTESTKKLLEIVEQLGEDDKYTFPEAGLSRKAIEEIIRKHMQEWRRKENNPLNEPGNSSAQDSKSSSASARNEKVKNYESYFNDELTLMSSTAIILAGLNKPAISDITLHSLKEEAKQLGLNLLRNKDKNTHIKTITSTLLKQGEVTISESVDLQKISIDDVKITKISS